MHRALAPLAAAVAPSTEEGCLPSLSRKYGIDRPAPTALSGGFGVAARVMDAIVRMLESTGDGPGRRGRGGAHPDSAVLRRS